MSILPFISDNIPTILAALVAFAAGFLKTTLTDAIKDRFSRPSKLFPDMRGTWCIYAENQANFTEQLVITWQYTKNFKGILLSPTTKNSSVSIKQVVKGEFVDSNTALCTMVIHNDETVKEFGAGLIRLNNDLSTGKGISVVYGITSNEPLVWEYSFERNIDPKGNRLKECSDDSCKSCVAYTGTRQ